MNAMVGIWALLAVIAVVLIVIGLLTGNLIVAVAVPLGIIACAVFLLTQRKNKKPMGDIICPQCGKPVRNDKNFCTNCGAKIE